MNITTIDFRILECVRNNCEYYNSDNPALVTCLANSSNLIKNICVDI